MKKPVFVDTAAWLALLNKSDTLHENAKRIRNKLVKERRQFLLTDYIVVEIANALSRVSFQAGSCSDNIAYPVFRQYRGCWGRQRDFR